MARKIQNMLAVGGLAAGLAASIVTGGSLLAQSATPTGDEMMDMATPTPRHGSDEDHASGEHSEGNMHQMMRDRHAMMDMMHHDIMDDGGMMSGMEDMGTPER